MQANEFDDLIRSKFDKEEFTYKPELWHKLSQQLPVVEEKKKRIPILWWQVSGIAAAVAVVALSVINWNQPAKEQTVAKSEKVESPSILQQPSAPAASVAVVSELFKEKKQEQLNSGSTSDKNSNGRPVSVANRKNQNKTKAVVPVATLPGEEQGEVAADHPGSDFAEKTNEAVTVSVVQEKKKPYVPTETYDPLLLSMLEKPQHKTSFSFTGGVNYGSLSTGYMVGVTAQRNISRKIYVEGNVGFVNGNADAVATLTASSAVPYRSSGLTPHSQDGEPSAVMMAETSITTMTPMNLYYFQVAPVVGYNVYKGLSIGVGADFQRLLQQEGYVVRNDAGRLRNLTTLDVGITGKTEYQISKKIKAGILYRNGLSNIILKNKLYLDRDYLQVQFRYTFIH